MNKVLITGSSGMLGKDIAKILSKNKYFNIFGFDKQINSDFNRKKQIIGDLTNFDFLRKNIIEINPDIIIHCAAIVNLNLCEENKKDAYALHYEVTNILSSYNSNSTKFIYISTDSIFDGEKGNYYETDIPNPINYYGGSKLLGEQIALKNNANSLIIRTNIYGFSYPEGNSLAQWSINSLENKKQINGFNDMIFNAIYTKQLARIIKDLIINNKYNGILNVAGDQYISKYDFIVKIAKVFNFPIDLIRKSNSEEMNFSVIRPKNTSLNITNLEKIIDKIPNISDGLDEFKRDFKETFKEVKNDKNKNR